MSIFLVVILDFGVVTELSLVEVVVAVEVDVVVVVVVLKVVVIVVVGFEGVVEVSSKTMIVLLSTIVSESTTSVNCW